MCGFVFIGTPLKFNIRQSLESMAHRGPDSFGLWTSKHVALGHLRLSIIDLSEAGTQPMSSSDERYHIIYNGEIYNYLEIREELGGSNAFATNTDTEVLLAAYMKWGIDCLSRLNGMFAFAVWDDFEKKLFAARDRFGVKPLFFHNSVKNGLILASEIKALHNLGIPRTPDPVTWSNYLSYGIYDNSERTFWEGISCVPPGKYLKWSPEKDITIDDWYDIGAEVLKKGPDDRDGNIVADELLALLEDSVKLRFRSDVPLGICLSGGLDSSLLLGLIHRIKGNDSDLKTFTFICGDKNYDETPWVEAMLARTRHPSFFCLLKAEEIPYLAAKMQHYQDEPYGGLPTLGMSKVFECARDKNVTVLLDGNGMDEGWAGYDYYARAATVDTSLGPVQGARSRSTRQDCLRKDFSSLATSFKYDKPFNDPLRDLQYRDIKYTKIPRAMRFADRASMMFSREIRQPFLDYRILELGLRQPSERKIFNGVGKWLPRCITSELLPKKVCEAPKRAVQTPQREWLRGSLSKWTEECIDKGLAGWGRDWLDSDLTKAAWRDYLNFGSDNSFPIWQWISLGMMTGE